MNEELAFKIKTEIFEGPLDLLLSLIEKRKLLINDISLAKVADDFIAYTRQLSDFPVAMSAHFILIASTLVLIKSKSLLPALNLSEEEQGSIEDLERRLKLYQKIRDISRAIGKKFGEQPVFLPERRNVAVVFSPQEKMTVPNFTLSLRQLLSSLPKQPVLPKAVVEKVISLEQMIENLTVRIQSSLRLSFREFSRMGSEKKVNVIVSFLAMLELVKQGIISVRQENHFDEITIETEKIDVPKYV